MLNGIHHVAINVVDIQRSIAFYRDVLGFEPLFEIEEVSGPGFGRATKIEGAKIRYTHLKVGDGSTLIELVQFLQPKSMSMIRTGGHIEFKIDDIDRAKKELEAKGIRFNSDPIRIGDGPLKGKSYFYFEDPDGTLIGLIE